MKKTARVHKPVRYEDFDIPEDRGIIREYGPIALGGVMLVMAFAFAGHYMGQTAIAHNAVPNESLEAVVAPSSNIVAKGSLLPEGTNFEIVNMTTIMRKQAVSVGQGDIVKPEAPAAKPKTAPQAVRIIPAAVNLKEQNDLQPEKKRIALAPSKAKVEQTFKLKRTEKQKVVAQRRVKLAEENCLARAVYFEARSESEMGQLAVAKVILNRVRDPNFPNSICGVVYQGSGSRNSCQFSFACDGMPDDVRQPNAWANSKRIARMALAGDSKVAAVGSATNYHADYVRPKWAKSMKRLIKIGRHIFYQDT